MDWQAVAEPLQWLVLAYFAGLNLMFIALNLLALRVIGDDGPTRLLAGLPAFSAGLEPGISVVVPAYNEAATIAASVRSMLQLDHPDFEVVVVNDGSKDDTLEVLKAEFDLQPFPEAYRIAVPVQPVRGIWRSTLHPTLRVVDKAHGGRADALNAGINAARHGLFCAVDADSVLQRDSLKRVARPFMEDARVIACSGTVRIANGCTVSQGFVAEVDVPRNGLARVQVVESLRAVLFGRLGWSPLNALLIGFGAFGLFRRTTVIDAGGYRSSTIGEDMELVARLHRLHRLAGTPYRIVGLPDPICWTEAPETLAALKTQRVRGQHGLMASLWANRALLGHRKGGAVGWLAFPAVLVFEGLGPAIELAGYVVMALLFATGQISGPAFLAFLLLVVGLGLMLSASALLLEALSFRLYPKKRHLAQLLGAMLIENLGYRQLETWWRFVGLARWATGRPARSGAMPRRGVGTPGSRP